MNTNKRIKLLWRHYFAPTNREYDRKPCVIGTFGRNAATILDQLDAAAGISTRWRDKHFCPHPALWTCAGDHNEPNYVGARVALHEQHLGFTNTVVTFIESGPAPPYFWLGAEAEPKSVCAICEAHGYDHLGACDEKGALGFRIRRAA